MASKNDHADHLSVQNTLRDWLTKIGDPLWDPWPNVTDIPSSDNNENDNEYGNDCDDSDKDDSLEDTHYEADEDSFNAIKIDPTIKDGPYKYRGPKDEDGLPHHCGTMTYENGDVVTCGFRHGKRNGQVVIMSPRNDIARLVGTYQRGQLEGRGRVINNSTQVTDCFFHRGSIHGPVRKFAMKKFRVR